MKTSTKVALWGMAAGAAIAIGVEVATGGAITNGVINAIDAFKDKSMNAMSEAVDMASEAVDSATEAVNNAAEAVADAM